MRRRDKFRDDLAELENQARDHMSELMDPIDRCWQDDHELMMNSEKSYIDFVDTIVNKFTVRITELKDTLAKIEEEFKTKLKDVMELHTSMNKMLRETGRLIEETENAVRLEDEATVAAEATGAWGMLARGASKVLLSPRRSRVNGSTA
jgi:hypothetical protein